MAAMPFEIIFVWLRGLFSVLLLLLGPYLLREWYEQSHVLVPSATTQGTTASAASTPVTERFDFDPGWNRQTALLAGGLAALLCALAGGPLLLRLFWRRGQDDPVHARGGDAYDLPRDDGGRVRVETYGNANGATVVLTHGLGTDSEEWYYAKRELGQSCRVVVWDTPGLGQSKRSSRQDFSLGSLAADLLSVARSASDRAGGTPVILVGHSMGGMIQLELCKRFPDELGRTIAGLVQVGTTYTNPVNTARHGGLYRALQKPLIEPLLHLTVWLSPLVRLMGVLSYLNGSAHLSRKRSGFGGTETYGQVDFLARYAMTSPPSVNARIMLAILGWDATATLAAVTVPTLIVVGDRDPTCLPEASGRMRADIPQARLTELAPGKHYAMLEHHAEFAKVVGAFVAQHAK